MKSKEVLELLKITRPTTLPNGRYDYNKDSVCKLFNKGIDRKTHVYAKVSTLKQKSDLENQINMLKQFCFLIIV